ncbi:MAG: LysM peptidoglycan-binding domain-containing protein [Anaerolineae bacterium]|nr:LysM peptidoglycan-binding domain-containing protein [Anaerolineae bacterium]
MCKHRLFILIAISVVSLTFISSCNTGTPTAASPSPTLAPFGEVLADNVPARNEPGDDYDKVGDFSRGDTVELILTDGEWIKVRSERFDGEVWIYARFVRQIASLPPSPTLQVTLASTLPLPSSATPTPEPLSATPTPTSTPTLTSLPSATSTSLPMAGTPEPEAPCDSPPPGWVIYTIQPGDTIYSLARNTGTTIEALAQANCIQDVTKIYAGQKLYVPKLPPTPTLPPPPSPKPTPVPPGMTPTLPPPPTQEPTPTGTPTMTP